jgi:hypothetical protein
MSPEQARGEQVDKRTDVYSLGALLYFTLAGAPPFEDDGSRAVLDRVRREPPRLISELQPRAPRDLVAIVEKALAHDRDQRYADAQAFVDDLRRFQTGKLVAAHDYSYVQLFSRWVQRHRTIVLASALLTIALVVSGSVGVRLRQGLLAAKLATTKAEKRVEAVEGSPRHWPANLPAAYRGEALKPRIDAMLQKTGLGSLADFNCDEYPCIAVIDPKQGDANWQSKLETAIHQLTQSDDFGPHPHMAMWGSHTVEDDGRLVIFSAVVLTPQADYDSALKKRTSTRVGAAFSRLGR